MNTNFNFTDGLMIVFLSTGLQLGCVVDNPGADAGMDSANDTSIVSAMLDAGMEDRDAGQTVDAGRTDIADQMIPHDVSIPHSTHLPLNPISQLIRLYLSICGPRPNRYSAMSTLNLMHPSRKAFTTKPVHLTFLV